MKVQLDSNAIMPTRANETDAGYDLHCRESKMIWSGHSAEFDTGVHVELPPGTFGLVLSRSGLNFKYGIVAAGNGVIDSGYRGSIGVKLYNFGPECYRTQIGDRIAQLVILPYLSPELELVDELEESDRGGSGYGSTGR